MRPGALQNNNAHGSFDQDPGGLRSVVAAVTVKATMFGTPIVAVEQSPNRMGPGALQINNAHGSYDQDPGGLRSVVAAVTVKATLFDTPIVAVEQSPNRMRRRRGTGRPSEQ
jgi:hypothetical protein